jgi:hypothetical protein
MMYLDGTANDPGREFIKLMLRVLRGEKSLCVLLNDPSMLYGDEPYI